jgi:hypothetical protein
MKSVQSECPVRARSIQTEEAPAPRPAQTSEAVTDDWVGYTPPDHSYGMSMYENDDISSQTIELTRDEYLALKKQVAEMRGYATARAKTAPTTASQESRPASDVQSREHRKIFGKFPIRKNQTLSQDERDELYAEVLTEVKELSSSNLHEIAMFLEVLRTDYGSTTPAEEFIIGLIRIHGFFGLQPQDVQRDLEEFQQNFEAAIETTKHMAEMYPKLFRP